MVFCLYWTIYWHIGVTELTLSIGSIDSVNFCQLQTILSNQDARSLCATIVLQNEDKVNNAMFGALLCVT